MNQVSQAVIKAWKEKISKEQLKRVVQTTNMSMDINRTTNRNKALQAWENLFKDKLLKAHKAIDDLIKQGNYEQALIIWTEAMKYQSMMVAAMQTNILIEEMRRDGSLLMKFYFAIAAHEMGKKTLPFTFSLQEKQAAQNISLRVELQVLLSDIGLSLDPHLQDAHIDSAAEYRYELIRILSRNPDESSCISSIEALQERNLFHFMSQHQQPTTDNERKRLQVNHIRLLLLVSNMSSEYTRLVYRPMISILNRNQLASEETIQEMEATLNEHDSTRLQATMDMILGGQNSTPEEMSGKLNAIKRFQDRIPGLLSQQWSSIHKAIQALMSYLTLNPDPMLQGAQIDSAVEYQHKFSRIFFEQKDEESYISDIAQLQEENLLALDTVASGIKPIGDDERTQLKLNHLMIQLLASNIGVKFIKLAYKAMISMLKRTQLISEDKINKMETVKDESNPYKLLFMQNMILRDESCTLEDMGTQWNEKGTEFQKNVQSQVKIMQEKQLSSRWSFLQEIRLKLTHNNENQREKDSPPSTKERHSKPNPSAH